MWPQAQKCQSSHQKMEETRNGLSPRPPEEVQSCWHLDFRLPAFRTVRWGSTVLSHPFCGNFLWQAQETNTNSVTSLVPLSHGGFDLFLFSSCTGLFNLVPSSLGRVLSMGFLGPSWKSWRLQMNSPLPPWTPTACDGLDDGRNLDSNWK